MIMVSLSLSLSVSYSLSLSVSYSLVLLYWWSDRGQEEDRNAATDCSQPNEKKNNHGSVHCLLWLRVLVIPCLSLSPLCPSVGLTLLFSFVFFFSRVLSFPVLCLCLSVSICLCPWIISACLGHCLCAGFIRQYALSKQWNHLKVKVEIILYVGLPCKGTSSFLSCNVTWEEWHALYIQQFHFL